jgi:hypothetical protein
MAGATPDQIRIAALEEQQLEKDRQIDLLQAEVSLLRRTVQVIQADLSRLQAHCPSLPALLSTILPALPPILHVCEGRELRLLWRGSEHGFSGPEFHRRCDGHPNTITLVADVAGNVFGGFTPVPWESLEPSDLEQTYKPDPSGRSFLFTVRNPKGIRPRIFPLRPEERHHAIYCGPTKGPEFGAGMAGYGDLAIRSDADRSETSSTALGYSYAGVDDPQILTGRERFMVRDVEVFEVVP